MSLNLTAEVRPVPEMWPWEPRLYHSFVTYFMMFPKGKKQRNGIIQSFFAGDSCGLVPGGEGRLGVDKPTPGFLLLSVKRVPCVSGNTMVRMCGVEDE